MLPLSDPERLWNQNNELIKKAEETKIETRDSIEFLGKLS